MPELVSESNFSGEKSSHLTARALLLFVFVVEVSYISIRPLLPRQLEVNNWAHPVMRSVLSRVFELLTETEISHSG